MGSQVETDEFTEVIAGLNPAPPCEMGEVVDKMNSCTDPAKWIVFWRDPCENGGRLDGSKANVICGSHRRYIEEVLSRIVVVCGCCGSRVLGMGHVINRIEGL